MTPSFEAVVSPHFPGQHVSSWVITQSTWGRLARGGGESAQGNSEPGRLSVSQTFLWPISAKNINRTSPSSLPDGLIQMHEQEEAEKVLCLWAHSKRFTTPH